MDPHQEFTLMGLHCTGNILLRSEPSRPHGFASKISDFGMCRIKDMEVLESLQGTYSHMAPEVIQHRDFSEVSGQLILHCAHGRGPLAATIARTICWGA